jgi:hypothetical protein
MYDMGRKMIRPCPCCKSAHVHGGPCAFLVYGVRCLKCGLSVSREVDYKNPKLLSIKKLEKEALQKAIEAWNRRPDPGNQHGDEK